MSKIRVEKKHTFSGHRDAVYALTGGRKEGQFYSAGSDGYVVEWDFAKPDQGKLIAKVSNTIYSMIFDAKRDLLIIGQNFDGIHFIDVDQKKAVGSLSLTEAAIFDLKLLGDLLYVACGDGELIVVDIDKMIVRHRIKHSDQSLRCLAFSEKLQHLAAGYSDHHIRVFQLDDFKPVTTFEAHQKSVFCLSYSPDSETLISGGRDARLNFWDTKKLYEKKEEIVAHMYAINHLAFSPNDNFFVSCSMDKSIKVWDLSKFKLLKVIDRARHGGHGNSVNRLWWDLAGNNLMSASDDRTVSAWELEINF